MHYASLLSNRYEIGCGRGVVGTVRPPGVLLPAEIFPGMRLMIAAARTVSKSQP
jgi:hypothetical protein